MISVRRRALGRSWPLICCLSFAVLILSGCGSGRGHSNEEPEAAEGTQRQEADSATVRLAREIIARSGIVVGRAGPAELEITLESPGEVRANGDRTVQIRPRYAGIVRALDKSLGERVRAGERIAVIQSNESLSDYPIVASQGGLVTARNAAVGQAVETGDVLYTITDLSLVWVMMAVYPQDLGSIRAGQSAVVTAASGPAHSARGVISYVGPTSGEDARVSQARIVLTNPSGVWQPGLFVRVAAVVRRISAPVAVPTQSIVRTERGPAVFTARDTIFTLRPISVGRSDGRWTEVLSGLDAGTAVVVRSAFLLKAELGRAEVQHED